MVHPFPILLLQDEISSSNLLLDFYLGFVFRDLRGDFLDIRNNLKICGTAHLSQPLSSTNKLRPNLCFVIVYKNIALYPGLSLSFEAAVANEDPPVTSHKNL